MIDFQFSIFNFQIVDPLVHSGCRNTIIIINSVEEYGSGTINFSIFNFQFLVIDPFRLPYNPAAKVGR